MDFKEVLQDLLNSHGMKPADLCRETGIPTSLMSNYLKGTKSPGTDNSIKIANIFNVSLDELAGREKEKPATDKGDGLTNTQRELLELILKLDDARFAKVLDYIRDQVRLQNQ